MKRLLKVFGVSLLLGSMAAGAYYFSPCGLTSRKSSYTSMTGPCLQWRETPLRLRRL